MVIRKWAFAWSMCLAIAMQALGYAQPNATQIESLIRRLGNSSFAQREQARKELEAIGTPALEPLRRASKTTDAEASRRIAGLIRLFEDQLLTKQILAPKEVDLNLAGVSVIDAFKELSNKSGYPIQFLGDATPFAGKKVTIEGKMPFWQAFDKICQEGNLMERVQMEPALEPIRRNMRGVLPMPQPQPAGPIVVVNRGNEKSAISYAGAVKTEVRVRREAGSKTMIVQFIVSAEPRLVNHTLVGDPLLAKVLDKQGRTMALLTEPAKAIPDPYATNPYIMMGLNPTRRTVETRLKDNDQAARQIKELAGKLTMQVDLQNETIARIDKVLDAVGKSVDGLNGGTMKILAAKKLPSGDVEIQVSLADLSPNPLGPNVIIRGGGGVVIRGNINGRIIINGGNVQMNGNGNRTDLPDLLDAKGQKFKLANITSDSVQLVNGAGSRTVTIVYQPHPRQAEPRDLVLFGTRTHTVGVPFRFENVPLP